MMFFTRKLYDGVQPDSGWERRAEREWDRRRDTYEKYLALIRPRLPPGARRASRTTLHDGIITSAAMKGTKLRVVVDARGALGSHRGKHVELVFTDVTRSSEFGLARLRGCWWLYEEFHLASDDRFRMDVLFDKGELEIEAADLVVTSTLPRRKQRQL